MYTYKDIVKEGNNVLREKSSEVKMPLDDETLKELLDMMQYLVFSQNDDLAKKYGLRAGVGLAAPQVGIAKRMFCMLAYDPDTENNYSYALVNPVIISKSKEMTYLNGGEGCLSVDRPTTGLTPRYKAITFKAICVDLTNNKTKTIKKTLKGYPAIVFQHEYDHLDGVMYIDKLFDKLDQLKPLFDNEDEE